MAAARSLGFGPRTKDRCALDLLRWPRMSWLKSAAGGTLRITYEVAGWDGYRQA